MKMRIAALMALNLLAAFVAASAGGQAQWDERAVHGGVELWLLNDEGTAIVLRCAGEEVHAAFVFTEPIEAARGALVIGQLADVEPGRILPPHMRRSFPVAQVNDRTVQILSGPGLDFTLAMLGAAANMHVRTSAHGRSARVFRGGGQRLDARALPSSGRESAYRLRSIGLRRVHGDGPQRPHPRRRPQPRIMGPRRIHTGQ